MPEYLISSLMSQHFILILFLEVVNYSSVLVVCVSLVKIFKREKVNKPKELNYRKTVHLIIF